MLLKKYTNCIFAEGYYSPKERPVYDAKKSDYEASGSLLLLPVLLRSEMVASDWVLSLGQQNCLAYKFSAKNELP